MIESMGKIQELQDQFSSEIWEIRLQAADSLASINTEDALSFLKDQLNSSNNWKTGVINMFIETWYGDMLVFGNVKDDCHCQVEMFDGKTGKITVIAAAESPLGYEISDSGDDFLFIKTVLDNCRMQEDEENFHMKCFEYEIPKQELRERPCR